LVFDSFEEAIDNMFSLHLTSEQLQMRDAVRQFVAEEVKPVALKSDRLEAGDRQLPRDLFAKVSQLGLRTLALSEAAGGAGADNLTSCIVAEELAFGDLNLAVTMGETARLCHALFDQAMTSEQRERFLPSLLEDDDYHLAVACDEPDAERTLGAHYHCPGLPVAAVKTTAARQSNGDWIVNGAKCCVLNGPLAKLIAVRAKTAEGMATLLVPGDSHGLTVNATDGPHVWYHGFRAQLLFNECQVPAQNMLGTPGKDPLAEPQGRGIPITAAINLGVGRAAYEAALDYAKIRVQGGKTIIEHQAIATKLADMAINLEIARSAVWQAAWASDHPDAFADGSIPSIPLETITRVFVAEAVHHIALEAAECFGGMGVMRDMPMQKYVHDAMIFLHSGRNNTDDKLRVAEAIADFRR
jgi:alkylation response protein AidB-like acyl-CoA dehydrogenase